MSDRLDGATPYELKTIQERTDITEHERAYLAAGWVIEWMVRAGASHQLYRDHFFAIVDAVKAMRALLDENARLRAGVATNERIDTLVHMPSTEGVRCSACHAVIDMPTITAWRFNGEGWEHKCPGNHPQVGYFAAEPIPTASAQQVSKHLDGCRREYGRVCTCGVHLWRGPG